MAASIIRQVPQSDGTYRWTVTTGTVTRDFGPVFAGAILTGGGTVTTVSGKGIAGITPQGLITFTDNSTPTQLVLSAGATGPAPTIVTFAAGTAAQVGNLTNYNQALYPVTVAHTFGAVFDAAKHGPGVAVPGAAGAAGIPGLLASGTTLARGNLVYWNAAAGAWTDAKLVSHELLLGSVGMVDKDGNVIASGNGVDVTGLGFAAGSSYYLEARDANGRNLQVLPSPFPAGLMPSTTRAYANVGTVITSGAKTLLNFNFVAGIAPAASAANFSGTDFTFLPYSVTPTAAQIRRLVDTQGNYGASLNGLHAEGDAGLPDGGFPTPPPRKLVNGVLKNVMLFDIGYNGFHANTLAQWGPQQSGDWLNVFEVTDGNQTAPGFIFGANAAGTSMWGVRLYGACTLMAFQQITISGDTVSTSDFRGTVNVSGANKALMCMRLNISADGKTMSAKVWPYDTGRPLAQQALSEPAASSANSGTYTASTAFPAGYVMPVFNNGTFRRIYSAKSNDPAIPAQFDGDL